MKSGDFPAFPHPGHLLCNAYFYPGYFFKALVVNYPGEKKGFSLSGGEYLH